MLDVPDVLGQLADKSLLAVDDLRRRTRYRMLETIRQYAQERLEASGEAPEVRRRHADHFLGLAEAAGPHLRGADQLEWAWDLAPEIDNFRAALDWAVEHGDADRALRLVAPLAIHGIEVGYAAFDWADTAAAMPGSATHPLFATVAAWAAWGATLHGDLERARALQKSVDVVEEARGGRGVMPCRSAATLAFFSGDIEAARHHADEWVTVARASGEPYEVAQALVMQGAAVQFADFAASVPIYEEAVQIARDANIPSALAIALTSLSGTFTIAEPLLPEVAQRALSLAEEALEVATLVGDTTSIAGARGTPGLIAWRRGDWRTTLESALEMASFQLEIGGRVMVAPWLFGAVAALAGLGHTEAATVLVGAADTLVGTRWGPEWSLVMLEGVDASLLQRLGPERVAELRGRGATMGPVEAVEYLRAQAESVLGV